ncbi:MAG: hypothetical protein AMJ66_03165, partial [Betaproteobacteria bacterium SG8_40]
MCVYRSAEQPVNTTSETGRFQMPSSKTKNSTIATNQALPFSSARKLASLIRRRKIGCLELLDLYLERVARFNPHLNAVVVLDAERARA